ncbi:hypothetical protein CSAL01_04927 [Colletotrichum salicis]|uniref:Uncharacterized protein n=1 Tax=Colletotrichum salicis TaxID=1209931 RepID=A0A135RQ70_9PEZI|nr:hypothetical protein CSAL01_04927 [Colletotrichum salicis]
MVVAPQLFELRPRSDFCRRHFVPSSCSMSDLRGPEERSAEIAEHLIISVGDVEIIPWQYSPMTLSAHKLDVRNMNARSSSLDQERALMSRPMPRLG